MGCQAKLTCSSRVHWCMQTHANQDQQRPATAKPCLNQLLQVGAFMFGSVPLKTYLPDGDVRTSFLNCIQSARPAISLCFLPTQPPTNRIQPQIDVSLFAGPAAAAALKDTWAARLRAALVAEKGAAGGGGAAAAGYVVGDVAVINAEVSRLGGWVIPVMIGPRSSLQPRRNRHSRRNGHNRHRRNHCHPARSSSSSASWTESWSTSRSTRCGFGVDSLHGELGACMAGAACAVDKLVSIVSSSPLTSLPPSTSPSIQLGGMLTLNMLEEVDAAIGGGHIFKRSIILVRAARCSH
jgi:hypothetical protein